MRFATPRELLVGYEVKWLPEIPSNHAAGRLHSSLRSCTRTKDYQRYFTSDFPTRGEKMWQSLSVAMVINGTDMGRLGRLYYFTVT